MKRGLALFVTVVTAGALLGASGATAPNATPAGARLTTISSRVHSKGASLVIEATDPVGYVASRPDPLTITVDFRNVLGDDVANSVGASAKGPIAGVSVESTESLGAPTSRVRVTLSQPVAHRVRSERNTIVIDLDKPTGRPYVLPAATEQITGTNALAPDAMKALDIAQSPDAMLALDIAQSPLDPIVALGLTLPPSAPQTTGIPALNLGNRPLRSPPAQAPVQASLQAQTQGQVTAPESQTRYTGNPISLDFQGADLRAVLRSFAEISGLNMVIDPRVTGTVDVQLRDVPWDQALDIILRANGLGFRVDGTIVRIAPADVFTGEDRARGAAATAAAEAGQLTTLTRQLSYSKGDEIVTLLRAANVLSNRGTASVDVRTNTLIITDLQERLTNASDLINTIDKAQPQVEIEARIVQTNKNYARALGIQWGFNGAVTPALGNTTGLAFPNSGTLGGRVGNGTATQGPGATSTAVNLGAPAATSAVGLQLGSVNGAFNLDVALTALESSGNGRLLSTPKVSTLNNVAAEMTQGVQIPIQTATNNTVTVSFKDAALTLKVTPQITAANTVIMQIALENATPDFSNSVNGIPPINTQRAITTVLVLDGQTTVIGGIYTSSSTSTRDSTPGLGNIPLLGWLFRRQSITDQNTELLIFITPRIIKNL